MHPEKGLLRFGTAHDLKDVDNVAIRFRPFTDVPVVPCEKHFLTGYRLAEAV
jgi:hypothetical protein